MPQECVILLHGLARTHLSMTAMAGALRKSGYYVVNHNYQSRQQTIEKIAEQEIPKALAKCYKKSKCLKETMKIHFVTHSMGGILVRQYLSTNSINGLGKVVMLAPPNQGSEIVDKLGKFRFFKVFNGPAGLQLGTVNQSVPNSLGPWPDNAGQLGVIAGRQSINLFLSTLMSGRDDGKVSVERTKLPGMHDHKVMATTHPMIMRNRKVIEQVKTFLKQGAFSV